MIEAPAKRLQHEHSVPWFWPFSAAIELGEAGLQQFEDNLAYFGEAESIVAPPAPQWATPNRVILELDTMRLRDFSKADARPDAMAVLVDAPYAGHSAVIADYAPGQSLVETLLAAGLERVLVTDWKSATPSMRDYGIDKYLTDIDAAISRLGGRATLVGLCQGGWMSAMYTCLFPHKVAALVLAGAPIDTDAGDGPIKKIAHALPMKFYENMVAEGGGLMLGQAMLAGWKNMHPGEQYVGKFVDLYDHIEDKGYIKRTERFERWYENPIDLPGRYYLQAIKELFKDNRFAKGDFEALGRRLSLAAIDCPLYLLAGAADDITTPEQVFAAGALVRTPSAQIARQLVPGGHIGLFMGSNTLKDSWPGIAGWIAANTHPAAAAGVNREVQS